MTAARSPTADGGHRPPRIQWYLRRADRYMAECTKREQQEARAVGVTFRRGGKVYSFAPNGVRVPPGDQVLARTERGVDIGEVVVVKRHLDKDERDKPLKPLVRRATKDDVRREERLREREREAEALCNKKIAEHSLPMKLIDADYTFDGQRLVFFFSAEGRVDFRALVRDLAETFHCRIELRQIGVRDEAKMIGGLGPCGRPLCCAQWLRTFDPVGIKVAKDQGMPLNPAKISGICDRLMCCLRFEHEVYKELAARLPQNGDEVRAPGKVGVVKGVALLREMVTVQFQDNDGIQSVEVPAAELRKMRGHWLLVSEQLPAEPTAPVAETSTPETRTPETRTPERASSARRSTSLEESVPEATMREPRRGRRARPTEPETASGAEPAAPDKPRRQTGPPRPRGRGAPERPTEGGDGEKKRRRGRRNETPRGRRPGGPARTSAARPKVPRPKPPASDRGQQSTPRSRVGRPPGATLPKPARPDPRIPTGPVRRTGPRAATRSRPAPATSRATSRSAPPLGAGVGASRPSPAAVTSPAGPGERATEVQTDAPVRV